MNFIFDVVRDALLWMAERLHMTYTEANIIVYYGLVPLLFFVPVDVLLGTRPLCSLAFVALCVLVRWFIRDFARFSVKLFDLSVKLLNCFSRIGWDYVQASVWICVIFPVLFFCMLCFWAWNK